MLNPLNSIKRLRDHLREALIGNQPPEEIDEARFSYVTLQVARVTSHDPAAVEQRLAAIHREGGPDPEDASLAEQIVRDYCEREGINPGFFVLQM